MIVETQIDAVKKQIIDQINAWDTDDEKKQSAIKQVEAMDAKQLEEFLIKNKLISGEGQQCPFCMIVQGKLPSYKIGENTDAVAVLEINPVSEGHSIIIPKKHEDEKKISKSTNQLAKTIVDKIKEVLKPREVNITLSNVLGHGFLNIIPIYGDETKETKKPSEEQLKELQKKLLAETKATPKEKKKPSKPKKLQRAPRRIP